MHREEKILDPMRIINKQYYPLMGYLLTISHFGILL